MPNDTTATRCYICGHGNEQALEQHHLIPRRYGGSDTAENLVHLCGSCHNAIESLYDDSFYHRLSILLEERDVQDVEDDLAGDRLDPADSPDRVIPVDESPHVIEGDDDRLHCGYCPTAFDEHNHAGLSRHLRFEHGVGDPYEHADHTFRDIDGAPPEEIIPRLSNLK